MNIEPYDASRLDAGIRLSLRAWQPVFASVEEAMGAEIFRAQHPDWRVTQRQAVESVCADENVHVWVASEGEQTVGVVALKLHEDESIGEITMMAVDPDFQRCGIAPALTTPAILISPRDFGYFRWRPVSKRCERLAGW